MSGRLERKRVVLVGAGQTKGESIGFGRATALLFAREGARLMIVDIDRDSAEETARMVAQDGGSAVVHIADHTSEEDCRDMAAAALEELGGIDVLYDGVGIVGVGGRRPLLEVTAEVWDRVMDVNLKGMFLAARSILPLMVSQGLGGSIVLISSLGAVGGLRGAPSTYAISKAGVNRLVSFLAAEYAQYNIRCNGIMPGLIDTPMAIDGSLDVDGYTETGLTREEYVAQRDAAVPMAYKGSAIDVAYAALYFASDESRYVSGALLPIDGALYVS
jgi:NAD(P)-dependent dehydrogenase (short-subunit alcohol dehydrogenase family)